MDTDRSMAPNKGLLLVLIGISLMIMVGLIVGVVLLRGRPQQSTATGGPSPAMTMASPTEVARVTPRISPVSTRTPDALPSRKVVNSLPTNFSFEVSPDTDVNWKDNSANDYFAQYIVLKDPASPLTVTIDRTRARLPVTQLPKPPGDAPPRPYATNEADFELIATVDGKDLYVSKTGAETVSYETGAPRLQSLPAMTPKPDGYIGERADYYVYQKYPTGYSEYLSVFMDPSGTYPSSDNYVLVSYSVSTVSGAGDWATHRETLRNILSSMKKK